MKLVLPNNYIEIDVFGRGGYWTHRGNAEWSYTLTEVIVQEFQIFNTLEQD